MSELWKDGASYSVRPHSTVQIQICTSPIVRCIHHWTELLENAERFHGSREYSVAVVVAQTACEVIAERAISKAFANKGIPELESSVTNFLISYNLGNERVQKLYAALTGDNIVGKELWMAIKRLAKTRNKSVHTGREVSETESREGLDAAHQLVAGVFEQNVKLI